MKRASERCITHLESSFAHSISHIEQTSRLATYLDSSSTKKPIEHIQVSPKAVKELRDKSGAGMMDCKKALAMNNGDLQAAADFLRAKGLARADKKASRAATEGAIGAYIHAGSRFGRASSAALKAFDDAWLCLLLCTCLVFWTC